MSIAQPAAEAAMAPTATGVTSWAYSFATDPEKAYETLNKRLQASQTGVKQVLDHFTERSQLDHDYTKKFLKIVEHQALRDEPATTLRSAEEFYQKQLEVMVRTHQQMNQKIQEFLIDPLQTFSNNKKLTQKHFDHEYERHTKAVKASFATMEKKAKEYASRCREEVKCAEKVSQSSSNNKLTTKDCEKLVDAHKKAKQQMEASELEYKAAITRHNQFQLAFDNKWAELTETLRAKEEEGLQLTADALRKLTLAQLDLYQLHAKSVQRILENLDTIKPAEDMNAFVGINKTGNLLPPRYTFVSFYDLPTNSGRTPGPAELRNAFQITLEEEVAHGHAPFDPTSLAGQRASRSSLALNQQAAQSLSNLTEAVATAYAAAAGPPSPKTAESDHTESSPSTNVEEPAPLNRTGSQRSLGGARGVQVLPPPAQIQLRKTGSLTRVNGVTTGAGGQQPTSPLANQVTMPDSESTDDLVENDGNTDTVATNDDNAPSNTAVECEQV